MGAAMPIGLDDLQIVEGVSVINVVAEIRPGNITPESYTGQIYRDPEYWTTFDGLQELKRKLSNPAELQKLVDKVGAAYVEQLKTLGGELETARSKQAPLRPTYVDNLKREIDLVRAPIKIGVTQFFSVFTLHFIELAVIDGSQSACLETGKAYFLFNAYFDGDVGTYLDATIGAFPRRIDLLWSHCSGFPDTKSGSVRNPPLGTVVSPDSARPTEEFRNFIAAHRLDHQGSARTAYGVATYRPFDKPNVAPCTVGDIKQRRGIP
jgi:hypothetical protein